MSDTKDTEKTLFEALARQEAALNQIDALADLKKDYVAYAGEELEEGAVRASKEEIIEALKTVQDPEIMINIYDLGLVYDLRQKDSGNVEIDMTVTTPMCPVAGVLPQQAADAVADLSGVGRVEVKIVWEPAWTPEFMSDDAKMMFELF
jgi:FeS assembly SUF system protein